MTQFKEIYNIYYDKDNKINISQLMPQLNIGFLLVDFDLKILNINKKAIHLLGWENLNLESNLNKEFLSLSNKDFLIPILKYLITYNHHKNPENKISIFFYQDDIQYQFFLPFFENSFSKKNCIVIILHSQDNLFHSHISHEFKAPLVNIQAFLETLIEYYDYISDKEKKEFLNIANNEVLRLNRLVNNIFNYFKFNNFEYEVNELEISHIINQTIQSYQFSALNKKVTLLLEKEKPCLIKGNYDRLFQVISNLIDNSLKFSVAEGIIVVRIFVYYQNKNHSTKFFHNKKNYKTIRIEVSDNGYGIEITKQKLLLTSLLTKHLDFRNTGFGLKIINNILKYYTSKIHFVSDQRVGSCFWFDLPFTDL